MVESHPPLAELLALAARARAGIEVGFRDLEDGSLAALSAFPEQIVDPPGTGRRASSNASRAITRTSSPPGWSGSASELAAGTAPREAGLASVLAWAKPR